MANPKTITITNKDNSYESQISNGRHTIIADEPKDLGGTDKGMDPVDLILAGLAECKVVTVRAKAEKLGIDLGEIRATLSLETGKGEGRNLASIVKVDLDWGAETSKEITEKILSAAGRCYVHRLLQGSFDISTNKM